MTQKIAFLFPGQGSQSVGMLNAFASEDRVLAQFSDIAQRALGENLLSLIESGPAEQLNLTVNTQPAMLLVDVMVLHVWRSLGGVEPSMVAGHSLGEYAALVAAGVLSLDEALKVVRVRAQAMQEAVPVGYGGMAAILGLTDDQVKVACAQVLDAGELAEPVNFNAPSQVVIAGTAKGVKLACEQAKALGAKRALELPVSAPFHSSLMRPAADQLASYLSSVAFSSPKIPLFNNIDVQVEYEPVRIKDALIRQAYGPVRWVETIREMEKAGATLFLECGPGKVLSGLVKRISEVPVVSMFDPESVRVALQL